MGEAASKIGPMLAVQPLRTIYQGAFVPFTLFIQKDSPGKENETNWRPAPAGPFYSIPRVYAPRPVAINLLTDVQSWPVPPAVPVN
jgi:hypothetical protein